MDNIKLNFFHKFIYSVYNFDFYKKVAYEKLNKGFLYLLILTIFLSIFTLINPMKNLFNYVDNIEYKITNVLPDFKLENGILKSDSDEVFEFEISELIVIFDTANKSTENKLNNYTAGFYINDTKIVYKNIFYGQTFNFNQFPEIVYSKSDFLKMIPDFKYLSIPIIFFMIFIFYLGNIFSALILSVIILRLKKQYMPFFKYSDCMKISIYALTVSFIFNSILSILSFESSIFSTFIFYAIGYFYALKAFKSIHELEE